MYTRKLPLGYLILLSLVMYIALNISSCGITSLPSNVQESIGKTESEIARANNKLANSKSIKHNNFIEHAPTAYLSNQVIMQNNIDYLPPIFNDTIQIDKQFFGLKNVAGTLTDLTKLPIVIDITAVDASNYDCNDVRITQQEGTLVDLLNLIGARCDLSWMYRDGKLILSDTETKTWIVKNIPGDIQVQNQVNSNSGVQSQSGLSSGSTGGSNSQSQQNAIQNVAFNLQNSLWNNLKDGIENIKSKNGKFNISPSTSSLTVTDKPSVLLRIDRYMKKQNEIMSRQVQIDIQILNVDVDATDNYGINWGLVFNGADVGFSINGQAVSQGTTGGTAGFTPSPVFVPTSTTQAFTVTANSSNLTGSQLIINALSTIAKTSLVTSTAVTTLSNQPVPVQFVDQQGYLASVTTTQTVDVGSQTALTPGQITTGFTLNVLPVIQSDGAVYMQLSINLSALKQISQFSSNGSSIQLPETLQRNLMEKAVVRSGDCFVLVGYDSDSQAITNTGVGGAYEWLLGGGVSAQKTRTRMVILVTPRVVNI
ncbi:MAG: PilN family type IVB pilus formation outer membrane protein [Burkholderiales bacterium]|nr:PilN family type IVB pilus formation outer membrane protein [Burkholderiales bacterium]